MICAAAVQPARRGRFAAIDEPHAARTPNVAHVRLGAGATAARALTNLTKSAAAAREAMAKPSRKSVNLYEAKTHLSSLVEDAARGEEIVISKKGVPRAMLVPLPKTQAVRRPARALRVTYLAADFDAPDPSLAALFEGEATEE